MSTELRPYPFAAATDPFDPPAELAWLRSNDPVTRVRLSTGDDVWLVTRYDDVRAVLAEPGLSRDLSRPGVARLHPDGSRHLSGPFADPPAHTRWRALVSKAFTARQVEKLRGRVEEITHRLLDDVLTAGPPVDLMDAFAYPLPITVISEILGVPVVDQRAFRGWAGAWLSPDGITGEERTAAIVAMADYARDLIRARRQDRGDDLLGRLLVVTDENDGRLTEDEVVVTIMTLIIGGYESTATTIGTAVLALHRRPDQLAALRADPGRLVAAVEELLRYSLLDNGFGSPRYTPVDITVGDVRVPAGSTLLIIRRSANRDGTRFPDPDRLDLSRAGAQHHLTFGAGPHFCLGAPLARLELQVALAALLARLPNLRLAVPVEGIVWQARFAASGPKALPVTW
ncbi:MAG: hypothetical protein V7637_5614 [Mycobacteriales bacterium]|jgi:cytochrome P450